MPAVSQCQKFCLLFYIKMADEGEKRVKNRLEYKEQCFALNLNIMSKRIWKQREILSLPYKETLTGMHVFVHHKDLKKSVAVLD